jgi:hypothetical protein
VGRQCDCNHPAVLTQQVRRNCADINSPVGAMPSGRGPSKRPRRLFFLLAGRQGSERIDAHQGRASWTIQYFSNYEATLKIAARLRFTSPSVVAHDDTLMRIAV